jgi:hypothetical protein
VAKSRGTYLLYSGVRVIRSDGSGARSLADGWYIAWSHDGSHVYYAVSRSIEHCEPELHSIPIDGGPATTIGAALKPLDEGFTWSPDDRQIAFFRYLDNPQCNWQDNPDARVALMVMNSDGSSQRIVLPELPQSGPLYWSPNGDQLYVWQGYWGTGWGDEVPGPIIRVRVADGSITRVSPSRVYGYFALSPDGSKLAATSWGDDTSNHLWVSNADGTGEREIGARSSIYLRPVWSRDSHALAVLRAPGDTHGYGPAFLAVARPYTSTPVDIYSGVPANGGQKATWGPGDTKVACPARGPGYGIAVMPTDGHAPLTIAAGNNGTALWQP